LFTGTRVIPAEGRVEARGKFVKKGEVVKKEDGNEVGEAVENTGGNGDVTRVAETDIDMAES
jgi:hypothetical protein